MFRDTWNKRRGYTRQWINESVITTIMFVTSQMSTYKPYPEGEFISLICEYILILTS